MSTKIVRLFSGFIKRLSGCIALNTLSVQKRIHPNPEIRNYFVSWTTFSKFCSIAYYQLYTEQSGYKIQDFVIFGKTWTDHIFKTSHYVVISFSRRGRGWGMTTPWKSQPLQISSLFVHNCKTRSGQYIFTHICLPASLCQSHVNQSAKHRAEGNMMA